MVERVSQPPFPSGADRGNAVLLLLIYFLNGSPDAHLIQDFRREEERNLIGPGNILGTVAVENSGHFLFRLVSDGDEAEELENQVRSICCLYSMFDGCGGYADGSAAHAKNS